MAINYPTSLDVLSNPTGANDLSTGSVLHTTQHANANDAIEALEAKLGIDSSTPVANSFLVGTGAGNSSWSTTPTLGSTSWTNLNHAHAAANSGGQISAGNLSGTTLAAGVTASSLTSVGTLTGLTMGGALNCANNIISNIGAAGTDFTATGGLTLADTLTVSGGGLTVTGNSTITGTLGGITTLAASGAVTLGTAGVASGIINSADGFYINIDSNNDGVDALFVIGANRTSATGGAGTLFSVSEGGALTGANSLALGAAGSSLGSIALSGNTSGTVTIQPAAAAGTWTLTLPTDDGDAGEQLQTNGSGVTSWEAAGSLWMFKDVLSTLDPQVALTRILAAPVSLFRYRQQEPSGPRLTTTGDHETVYAGVMADEAPWAMHHNGRIFSPVSAFGHASAAIQALWQRINVLQQRLALLEGAA